MLTKRQQLTVEHLKYIQHITEPAEIIQFCMDKLAKPNEGTARHTAKRKGLKPPSKSLTRKHSRAYYLQIIEHFKDQR